MSSYNRVPKLLDTTMREGEQTPDVRFTLEQKLQIFDKLVEFGIDYIEVGHPAVHPDIAYATKAIVEHKKERGYDTPVIAHARLLEEDLDDALECGVDGVGFFYCVRDERLEQVFKRDMNKVEKNIRKVVGLAANNDLKFIRYTPEDTVRSKRKNVLRATVAALESGANVISVADTTAYMEPHSMYNYIRWLKKNIKQHFDGESQEYQIAVHCHNDLGLAVANAIAAYRAGADIIDVSVNGIGERAGITNLHSLCAVFHSRYKTDKWALPVIKDLSKMVEEFTELKIYALEPIIGKNASKHCAGAHAAARIHNPEHYRHIDFEAFGVKEVTVVDHMAGRASILMFARENNIGELTDAQVKFILDRVKTRDKGVSVEEFRRLVRETERNGLDKYYQIK